MFCGNCGEKLEDGAKFCGKCGQKVEVPAEAVAEVAAAAEVPAAEEVAAPAEEPVAEAPKPVEEPIVEEAPVVEEAAKEEAPVAVEEPIIEEAATPAAAVSVAETAAGSGEPAEEGKKKKKGKFFLIPLVLVLIAAVIVGIVFIVNGNKKITVDLTGIVTFKVDGYSGYGEATVTIDEDALEEKYEEEVLKHTDLKFSKFIKEVDLLEYEVSGLEDLKNGDKITLTWKSDTKKAEEEYKVILVCDAVEYAVSGLKEVKNIDPFEDFEVIFSGVSGTGNVEVTYDEYPDYLQYFWYEITPNYDLKNGDQVVMSFKVEEKGDLVAENAGFRLSPTEKTFTVSGLQEYVTKDEQITDDVIKMMAVDAEEYFFKQNSGWSKEASVKNLECVGHFIALPDNKYGSVHNAVCVVLKASSELYKEGRSMDVDFYYPVFFKNVILNADGTVQYNENQLTRTSADFTKNFVAENEEDTNVPGGTWRYIGYETKEAMVEAYADFVLSGEKMKSGTLVEKAYDDIVKAEAKKEAAEFAEKVKSADASAVVAEAVSVALKRAESWPDTASINGMKCVETALLGSNVSFNNSAKNLFAVVLEVDAKVTYKETSENVVHYEVVLFENAELNADGSLKVNVESGTVLGDYTFNKMIGEEEIYEGFFSTAVNVWVFEGFETLEALHKELAVVRNNHVIYTGEFVAYTAADATDVNEWSKADDSVAVKLAEESFRETAATWRESVTVSAVECVDTYLIASGVETEPVNYAVLLKVTAEVAFADQTEAVEYYYTVTFEDAKLAADGTVTVDKEKKTLTVNPFTKMLGDEEVPGADGEEPLNVWNFDGYATAEEAEAALVPEQAGKLTYSVTKVPEAPVVEEPTEEPTEQPTENPTEELYDVELTEVGSEKVKVIAAIRDITGLGLAEAKDLTDTAPGMVKTGVTKDEAEAIKSKLEAVGATVTLKPLVAEPVEGGEGENAEGDATEPDAEAGAAEGQTYTVELTVVGAEKVKVIKVVREVTGLGLKEAKDLVDNAPSLLLDGQTKEKAEEVKKLLEEVGATVTIK